METPRMRNQQHDPCLSHDARTDLPGTAVSGRGATGRGVEGVGRYLWCRETPGQRRARSRARLFGVIAPLSERSRAVGWLHHEVYDWLNGFRPAA